jgi:hypothetical protein
MLKKAHTKYFTIEENKFGIFAYLKKDYFTEELEAFVKNNFLDNYNYLKDEGFYDYVHFFHINEKLILGHIYRGIRTTKEKNKKSLRAIEKTEKLLKKAS